MNMLLWIAVLYVHPDITTAAVSLRRYYMEGRCGETISMNEQLITAGRFAVTNKAKYRHSLSCNVTIVAPSFMRLTFVFREMDIEYEVSCDDDFVTFYDGSDTKASIIPGTKPRMCGHKIPSGSYVTSGVSLTVHFQSDIMRQDNGFEIVFTAFHIGHKCLEDEFRCDNERCISATLLCNDFNNCGDGSDLCKLDTSVAIALIASIFLLTVVGTGTITLYRKRKKKQLAKEKTADAVLSNPRLQSMPMTSLSEIHIVPCDLCSEKIIEEQRKKLGLSLDCDYTMGCTDLPGVNMRLCVNEDQSEARTDGAKGVTQGPSFGRSISMPSWPRQKRGTSGETNVANDSDLSYIDLM